MKLTITIDPAKRRNPATEIAIDNEAAKAAFVAWWATMMAQGYQYGYEALCNVWVGFDGGRADLARKVLKTVMAQSMNSRNIDYNYGYEQAQDNIAAALRETFQKEGIAYEVD